MTDRGAAVDIRWRSGLLLAAGFAGAAGVMLAAMASHIRPTALLETSAYFLLVHAVAVMALAALANQTSRPSAWLAVASIMLAGAMLFSTDLTLYAFRRTHLFPLAAPLGGTMLICSWLGVSFIAAVELTFPRRGPQMFEPEFPSSQT